ncbi:hypothetical protein [Myxococcus qinghaiensis]|uniref:hypothetical protein n=1 Tax=Myxococcus qinghaiensis TaxID=2906758 RepID=UPI0020A82BC3|nr:hypothetical protein [Myxococcus qinghaiensis]MCP3163225.1 hypothetical protein [Myxococcus qinghaiensis]
MDGEAYRELIDSGVDSDDEEDSGFDPDDVTSEVEATGFERCAVPKESPVARGVPDVGRLVVGDDRLWLAGSHVLASSVDGKRWTTHPVR